MGINAKAATDMMNFIFKSKANIQAVDKEVKLEIGRRLVDYSIVGNPMLWHPPYWPKDYNPGRFINNWQVGIDEMPVGTIGEIDASGEGSLARLKKLGRWTAGHTHYFVNNLVYAALLESGTHSSQVGPQGMVGRVTVEFPQIVRDAVNKVARSGSKAFEDNG
jgi:hypothetical protein